MQYRENKLPTATCSGAFQSEFRVYFAVYDQAWFWLLKICLENDEWLTVVENAIILRAEMILNLDHHHMYKWMLIFFNVHNFSYKTKLEMLEFLNLVIIDQVRLTDVPQRGLEIRKTNPVRTEPLIFFGQKYTCKRYFWKGLWIWFQKCLLLNYNTVKNLSQFVSQNLRCIVWISVADCPNYVAYCDAIQGKSFTEYHFKNVDANVELSVEMPHYFLICMPCGHDSGYVTPQFLYQFKTLHKCSFTLQVQRLFRTLSPSESLMNKEITNWHWCETYPIKATSKRVSYTHAVSSLVPTSVPLV